jgi:methylmalonyl-CoA/ethylmalonyl-CoA epimerase
VEIFQVAQRAVDLPRARDCYARLLQAQPTGEFDPPGLVFFQVGAARLMLDRAAPTALIYLRVLDVAEAIERCRVDGLEVVSEPQVIFSHADSRLGPAGTDEWMAFVRDSEGNTVGLVSHRPRG